MRQFQCDYVAGCHPALLQALTETNLDEEPGYGDDVPTLEAADLIRRACGAPEAAVHLFTGGTQANLTMIASVLRPGEGVVAADTGHVQAHETGAIEATGHRVIPLPGRDGKITAEQIEACFAAYENDGGAVLLVRPAMVYVSQPTELGTVYDAKELEAIAAVCRKHEAPLYVDGARLAYALAAEPSVDLPFLARTADAFYIGGTKCGALAGEAMVIPNPKIARGFRSQLRVRGALVAKGRLLGAQFRALFADGLYLRIGRRAVDQARRVREAFLAAGVPLYVDSPTNQLFVKLTDAQTEAFHKTIRTDASGRDTDGLRIERVCTAWSTTDEAMNDLLAAIAALPRA